MERIPLHPVYTLEQRGGRTEPLTDTLRPMYTILLHSGMSVEPKHCGSLKQAREKAAEYRKNGHYRKVEIVDTYDYRKQRQDMMEVGILDV